MPDSTRAHVALPPLADEGDNVEIEVSQDALLEPGRSSHILLRMSPARAAALAYVLTVPAADLAGFHGTETRQQVCDAWLSEGESSAPARGLRDALRVAWPRLARGLDALCGVAR